MIYITKYKCFVLHANALARFICTLFELLSSQNPEIPQSHSYSYSDCTTVLPILRAGTSWCINIWQPSKTRSGSFLYYAFSLLSFTAGLALLEKHMSNLKRLVSRRVLVSSPCAAKGICDTVSEPSYLLITSPHLTEHPVSSSVEISKGDIRIACRPYVKCELYQHHHFRKNSTP